MKVKIQNYTFNVALKKVTFLDYSTLRLDSLLLITNVTRNIIIYNFADTEAGGTISGNVVTLKADLTGMLNTDQLQIFYESEDIPATENSMFNTISSITWLKRIANLLSPLAVQDGNNRQRVVVDSSSLTNISSITSGVTLPTVTTVTTVSNIALIANIDPRYTMIDQAHTSYSTGIRSNLKFT